MTLLRNRKPTSADFIRPRSSKELRDFINRKLEAEAMQSEFLFDI